MLPDELHDFVSQRVLMKVPGIVSRDYLAIALLAK